MYSFNPGNQFALGNKKFQVLESISPTVLKVTDTENGHSHTMSTEELFNSYEKGELFFINGNEQLEENTIKKLLNPIDGPISVDNKKELVEDYLKRDPFSFDGRRN